MKAIRIVREYQTAKKLPEKKQFILPNNESYASSLCSKSARSRLTSRADTPNSLQLLDELCSPHGFGQPLQIETGNSLTRSEYGNRFHSNNGYNSTTLPLLHQSHQVLSSHSNSLVPLTSFKIHIEDLHDTLTSIEVDEKTLNCEVIEFFTLIENICQEGVRISMKNAADIAFSKNLFLDSFSALKTHIRILRGTYFKLKELDRGNSTLGNRQAANSVTRQAVIHDHGSISDRSDKSNRSVRSIDRNDPDYYPDEKEKERLKRQIQSKTFECEKLSKKVQLLIDELNELKPHAEKSADLEIENSELRRSVRTALNRSDQLSDEIRQLTRRLQNKDQTIEEAQNECLEIQNKLDKLSTERQKENSEKMALQAELETVRSSLVSVEEELKNKLFESECTIQEKNFEIKSLQDKYDKLQTKVENFKEKNSNETKKTAELELKINQLYYEIERKDNSLNDMTENLLHLQAERDLLKEKVVSVQQSVEKLHNDNAALKSTLQSRRGLYERTREELSFQLEGAGGGGSNSGYLSPIHPIRPYSSYTSLNTTDSIGRIQELQSKLKTSLSEQSRLKLEEATMERRSQYKISDLTRRLQESEATLNRLRSARVESPAPGGTDMSTDSHLDSPRSREENETN